MLPSLPDIAARYDTDKAAHPHYLANYERYFSEIRSEGVRLLELGIKQGGSLLMWRDYFGEGFIVGLDIEPFEVADSWERIRTYQGPQQDTDLLDHVASESAPEGFDIVIDDCAHIGVLARESFWHLFENHLKPGGWYVIEDWGTGYWPSWVDGAQYGAAQKAMSPSLYRATRLAHRLGSLPLIGRAFRHTKRALIRSQFAHHDYGMVGFVKELVDEMGMADRTHPETGADVQLSSRFAEMHVTQSHVFVRKGSLPVL
jgi:SAM-dependent methyltransferase